MKKDELELLLKKEQGKSKNRLIIIIALILFIIIGFYKSYYFLKKIKYDNDINKTAMINQEDFNGIYNNGNRSLKLICIDCINDNTFFLIDELTGSKYSLNYNDGVLIAWENDGKNTKGFNSVLKITKANNSIIVDANNEIENGFYTKIADYSFTEFYNEIFGNDEYINTAFNGNFESPGDLVSLYQKDENTLFFDGDVEREHWNFNLNINGNVATGNYLNYYIELEINNNKFTLRKYEEGNLTKETEYERVSSLSRLVIAESFFHN